MKLVRENINEFERGGDALTNLGIGKKVLIEKWLKQYGVEDYVINDDFTIDVNNIVQINKKDLITFPDYIQFNVVHGLFDVTNNNLLSLKGAPFKCQYFNCSGNQLRSLKYCPKEVYGDKYMDKWLFKCANNPVVFDKNEILRLCNFSNVRHLTRNDLKWHCIQVEY
jgi:hypothetical protein